MTEYEIEKGRVIKSNRIGKWKYKANSKNRGTRYESLDSLVRILVGFAIQDGEHPTFVAKKIKRKSMPLIEVYHQESEVSDNELAELTKKYITQAIKNYQERQIERDDKDRMKKVK